MTTTSQQTPSPRTAPPPQVWPAFRCRDARAEIRFLVDAFGFEERLVVPGDDGREVAHAELRWPNGGGVMLGSVAAPGGQEIASPPGGASVYVVTDDPDGLYERATKAGAVVVRELRDEDFGSRDFVVRDPEGNIWSFGTYAGAD